MTERASRERGFDAGVQALVKPPMMFKILDHSTDAASLKPITDESKRLEANPKILAASAAGGYQ